MGRTATRRRQRAATRTTTGYIERDGVRVCWEATASAIRRSCCMPTWSIVHSRHWKAQIPYLARHFRVVTFDGRGNGRSDRPRDPAAYADAEFVADALAVLDATGVQSGGDGRAVVRWALRALLLARSTPSASAASSLIAPSVPFADAATPGPTAYGFDEPSSMTVRGMGEEQPPLLARATTATSWSSSSPRSCREPHSTKQIEDCVALGRSTPRPRR